MKYRPRWTLLMIGILGVAMLFTFPTWRRFFTGRASQGAYPAASDAQREVLAKIAKSSRDIAATAYASMLTSVPAPTNEQPTPVLPDAQPIRTATFKNLDALRTARGDVTLWRSADGSLLLRFENFTVTHGPNLQVYLSGSAEPAQSTDLDSGGVSRFPVGPLKGTTGNQQYKIPRNLGITRYKSVVIYDDSLELIYTFATFK